MPTFQSDASSNTFTGSYNYTAASLTIPSGATVQEFAETDGSLVWIEPSGQFAIFWAASGWMMADVSSVPAAAARDVDDASVSGVLAYWFNEDSWDVSDGTSGVVSATSQDPGVGDVWVDYNTPSVASGSINGLDTLYCVGNKSIFETSPSSPPIADFQGTDAPHTLFAVVQPETVHLGNIFSLCRNIDNNDGQRNWGCHTNNGGLFYYFERDDANGADWKNIGGMSYDMGNQYTAGELMLVCWATSADGTTIRGWKNNVEWTAAPSGLETGLITPLDGGIGVNSRSNLDQNFVGEICEIAVYSSGMTDTEVAEIGQGLMTKWGV